MSLIKPPSKMFFVMLAPPATVKEDDVNEVALFVKGTLIPANACSKIVELTPAV